MYLTYPNSTTKPNNPNYIILPFTDHYTYLTYFNSCIEPNYITLPSAGYADYDIYLNSPIFSL